MALDESKEDDEVFEKGGLTFLINKELFEMAMPITVDYVVSRAGEGLKVTSSLDAGAGGSCGGSCSSC